VPAKKVVWGWALEMGYNQSFGGKDVFKKLSEQFLAAMPRPNYSRSA
jgi:hypothetical protein